MSPARSPAARVDDGTTFDLLGREKVGLDVGAVLEGDAGARPTDDSARDLS
jgi:hypothetical protein